MGLTTLTRAVAPGRTVADICRALESGRLHSVATVIEARGLMRVRLRMADVERALPSARETMSIVEAARTLGVNYEPLHLWARLGFLQTLSSSRRGERGLRITHEAWERFRRDYVPGGELGRLFGQPGNAWLSRHLVFQGVLPVSGPGVDSGRLALFCRSDCTEEVMAAVRRVQARPPGTPQDKHRRAFARVEVVGAAVAERWGVRLRRVNNRFTDPATGRTVQVVSGRRPDLTGSFRFQVVQKSLVRLRALPDAWVALVPSEDYTFLLVPLDRVRWRGENLDAGYVNVAFGRGRPLKMEEWALSLAGKEETS